MFHSSRQAAGSHSGPTLDVAGQVVIVTGGTKGVGRGIATAFLEAGTYEVVCARKPPETPVSASVGGDGAERTALFVEADVRDDAHIERVVKAVVDAHGRIDVLINNAGGTPFALAANASPRYSASIIALNLTAPLWFATRANAVMQAQESGGSIINIASVSGTRPSPGTGAYGAAKAGLLNLTQTLAVEWAPKVRVNAITAGLLKTEQSELHYGDEAGIAAVSRTVPLGRMGEPGDVADACLFLASSLSRYMSGANLLLHGGGEWPAFLKAAQEGMKKEPEKK
jgi:NAD(P)-dependent dehydrogenase (short-subunit alcohol dehydrogenase family)